jgi:hypothetical protein
VTVTSFDLIPIIHGAHSPTVSVIQYVPDNTIAKHHVYNFLALYIYSSSPHV